MNRIFSNQAPTVIFFSCRCEQAGNREVLEGLRTASAAVASRLYVCWHYGEDSTVRYVFFGWTGGAFRLSAVICSLLADGDIQGAIKLWQIHSTCPHTLMEPRTPPPTPPQQREKW